MAFLFFTLALHLTQSNSTTHKETHMAVTDTLFMDLASDGSWLVSDEETVVLETLCPKCGTALRVGSPDVRTTGGYFIPVLYCPNNCGQRPETHRGR
jgi:hypothetical protein